MTQQNQTNQDYPIFAKYTLNESITVYSAKITPSVACIYIQASREALNAIAETTVECSSRQGYQSSYFYARYLTTYPALVNLCAEHNLFAFDPTDLYAVRDGEISEAEGIRRAVHMKLSSTRNITDSISSRAKPETRDKRFEKFKQAAEQDLPSQKAQAISETLSTIQQWNNDYCAVTSRVLVENYFRRQSIFELTNPAIQQHQAEIARLKAQITQKADKITAARADMLKIYVTTELNDSLPPHQYKSIVERLSRGDEPRERTLFG